MAMIVISDLPGEEPGSGWKAYREAADALYWRCPSDKAYEDVMNGYAYLNEDDELVYYPCDEDDHQPGGLDTWDF